MFDLGWGELVLVGVIALIVIGPKELPTVLRTLGHYMGKVKRIANEFQGQFQEALREVELTDLKKQAEELTGDLNKSVSEFTEFDPMAETQREIERSFEAEPNNEAITEETKPAAGQATESEPETTAPAASAEASPEEPTVDLPPPEPPAPVGNEDFAPAEPPPHSPAKPAGGSA